jgi:hypothetical protein
LVSTPAQTSSWLRALPPVAAVLSHLTALPNGFTWLDHGDLEQGAAVAEPGQWLSLFTDGFARTAFYRPLTALSLSIDAWVGPAWMFHLSSVLFHALAAFALGLAAEALGLQRRIAALAGVLFAVHPLTSLIADQVSFRADALVAAALFGLIAAHLQGKAGIAAGLLFAAALSKETGLVLAPLFVAALAISRPRPPARVFVAEAIAWAAGLGLRLAFAPPWRSQQPELSGAEAIGTRLAGVAKSALTVVVPGGVCDAIAVAQPWDPWATAGLVIAACLALLAWRQRGAALLLVCAALPSLNLVAAPRFWSPHYAYLPWAFAAIVICAFAAERKGLWRAVIALCVIAGAYSLWDGRRFASDEALFAEDATRPECREANLYFGDARRAAGDLEAAARAYEIAAAPPKPGFLAYSDERAALQNLGLVRLAQGQHFEAELAFTQALAQTPDGPGRAALSHNLAAVALARGDPAGAVQLLEPIVGQPGVRRDSILLLARALFEMGREEEAKALLERGQRAQP